MTQTEPSTDQPSTIVDTPTGHCEVPWCIDLHTDDSTTEPVHHTGPWNQAVVAGRFKAEWCFDRDDGSPCSIQFGFSDNDVVHADDLTAFAMWLLGKAAEMRILDHPSLRIMPAEPKELAAWQLEPCPAWCVDVHRDYESPDEGRMHYGPERDVLLRLMRSAGAPGDDFQLARLHVLAKARDGGRPMVHVYTDDLDDLHALQLDFHPQEAADLASALLEAVEEVSR